MRAVNLLPRETGRQSRLTAENLPALVGAGMGVLVVAVVAGGYLMQSSKVATAQRALDAAQKQLAATPLPPPAEKPAVTVPAAVTAQQQPRLQAVSTALSQRIAWDRILREFSLVLPDDVWLSTVSLAAPTAGAAAGSASGLSLVGQTYSYASVARLLSRLALVPDLTNVTLSSTVRNGRTVGFTVGAGIKGGAAPAASAPAPPPPTTDTTSTDSTAVDGSTQ